VRQAATERNVGVLLVEQHVRKVLRIADRVYVMRRGRVVLEGPTADFQNTDLIERSYLSTEGA
jgi:branched-chain amino acid transport system ATP-binding protein